MRGLGRFRRLLKNQRGFTLVELLVGITILGVISGPLTISVFQMMTSPGQSSAHMNAVKQVERAIYHMTRDVQMSQTVDPDGGASGFPLTLEWTDWDSAQTNTVVYTLQDAVLERRHTAGSNTSTTEVAEDISSISCEYVDSVFTLTITSGMGGGDGASESRVVEIVPRTMI